jgi:hypothetical protein
MTERGAFNKSLGAYAHRAKHPDYYFRSKNKKIEENQEITISLTNFTQSDP